jgi:DnaD/phage-associated family protein
MTSDNFVRPIPDTLTDINKKIDDHPREDDQKTNNEQKKETDNSWATCLVEFENNIHPLGGAIQYDLFRALYNDFGADWLSHAIHLAAVHNARSVRYVEKILFRWRSAGFYAHDRPWLKQLNRKPNTDIDSENYERMRRELIAAEEVTLNAPG